MIASAVIIYFHDFLWIALFSLDFARPEGDFHKLPQRNRISLDRSQDPLSLLDSHLRHSETSFTPYNCLDKSFNTKIHTKRLFHSLTFQLKPAGSALVSATGFLLVIQLEYLDSVVYTPWTATIYNNQASLQI